MLQKVQDSLGSAKGWGVWDMLGGGLIVTAVKHSTTRNARYLMQLAGIDVAPDK